MISWPYACTYIPYIIYMHMHVCVCDMHMMHLHGYVLLCLNARKSLLVLYTYIEFSCNKLKLKAIYIILLQSHTNKVLSFATIYCITKIIKYYVHTTWAWLYKNTRVISVPCIMEFVAYSLSRSLIFQT